MSIRLARQIEREKSTPYIGSWPVVLIPCPNIVAPKGSVFADVQLAIGNHGMCQRLDVSTNRWRIPGSKPPALLVTARRGLAESHLSIIGMRIKSSVGKQASQVGQPLLP